MDYYVYFGENGQLLGFLAGDSVRPNKNATCVSRDQFVSLTGHDPEPASELTAEEILLELAADHEYRLSLQEMGLSESDLL